MGANVNSMNGPFVPGKSEMEAYLKRGLTQAQIVEAWEEDSSKRVSRSAIAMAIERYGLKSSKPRPRYEDMIPWTVKTEHASRRDVEYLRAEGRRRKGEALSEKEARRLTEWKKLLKEKGAVVTYNPDSEQGFFWVPFDPEKDAPGDLIRRP